MVEKAFSIRLLGELELVRDQRVLQLPASKKTRALLGYLVATGRPQLREKLCELLWEGPDDPRASLRWSLTKIRPLLDHGKTVRLVSDRERIAFEPAGADVDVARVRKLRLADASLEDLRAAAQSFRGEFLEGLDLPDCYRFHEWCIGERESLRGLRIAILDALVERLRGEPEQALRFARARLAIDPLVEAAQVRVIRLLGELGRKPEALKQYETCRRLIESQLSAQPSLELERVRMALGQAATPPPASRPVEVEPVVPMPSPLFGRRAERAMLEELVAAAAVGRAREILVVLGDPGIGKSRLLEEVKALVRASGGLVMAGRAFEAEMVRPYGAWIDALRSIRLEDVDPTLRPDLAPLLPELGTAPPTGGYRSRLFDAVARLLGRLSTNLPLALVLDDVHWLDEASAALLHYVARRLGASRLLLACGARPGELADNPAALRLVRAMTREGRLRQLMLGPLDAADTSALVRSVDAAIDPARVFIESDGNPLFALEIARALTTGQETLSSSLDGLIADRLSRLDERARELVPWAAALGHGFSADLLARTTGMPPGELLSAIGELERHCVLKAVDVGCDFVHDLIRRAAYRQLSEPRRRLVHGQIARAMAALPDPDGAMAGDLAHHAALAGEHELAARACRAGGERCVRVFAHAAAVELADRGLAQLQYLPREMRAELCIGLLRVKAFGLRSSWPKQAPELDAEVSRALFEAQARGLTKAVAEAFYVLSHMHHDAEDYGRTHEDTLAALEATRSTDPSSYPMQAASAARCLLQIEGDVARARALVTEVEQLAGRAGVDLSELTWGQGLVCYWDGDVEGALSKLERALALTRVEQKRWYEYECLEALSRIELELGRLGDQRCRELMGVAAKMGGGSEAPFATTLDALARLARGEDAMQEVERALTGLREIDSRSHLAYALNFVAEIDLAAGRLDDARRRAEEALAAAQLVRRRNATAIARALLARVAMARGDRAAAEDHLAPVLRQLGDRHALNARARSAVRLAAQALGLEIPTVDPTGPTTPGP